MKKQCFKCLEIKDLNEFYKHKGMLDGHLNKCKNCAKLDIRKYRFENDSVREYDRARYYNDPNRRADIAENSLNWFSKNPEAKKAHETLNNAVRDGKIIKQPCSICGSVYRIHGHHDDYSKPLDVKWFCAKHHQRYHHQIVE
jgi:hypothetical protein